MRIRFVYLCTALFMFGLILVCLSTASALEPKGITNDPEREGDLDISDSYIVWESYDGDDSEIYAYDLDSQSKFKVTNNPWNDDEEPKVWHDRLVYFSNNRMTLIYKNLTTSQPYILYDNWDSLDNHDVNGDWVVYACSTWSGDHYDVRLSKYNINTMSGPYIFWTGAFPNWANVDSIDIDRNKAASLVYSSGSAYLIYYNLQTDTLERNITMPYGTERCKIAGNNGRQLFCFNYMSGYFMYDLDTSKFKGITLGLGVFDGADFDVFGNMVIYGNITSETFGVDIFLYRLDTQETFRLTYSPTKIEQRLAIWGSRIAYIGAVDVYPDVLMLQFPMDPPDLSVESGDVLFDPSVPVGKEPVGINVRVTNHGFSPSDAMVRVTIPQGKDPPIFLSQNIGTVPQGESRMAMFQDVELTYFGHTDVEVSVAQVLVGEQVEEISLDNNKVHLTIYVNDRPTPVIEPRLNLTVATYEPIAFSAEKSLDKDGITMIVWDFGDGYGAVGEYGKHHWTDNGSYNVILTVYDIYGCKNSSSVIVEVENQAPVIVHDVPDIVPRQETVILSAAGSYDIDGSIVDVVWVFGDGGEEVNGLVVTYTFHSDVEETNFTLMMIDDDGAITEEVIDIVLVDKESRNIPPVAVIHMSGIGGNLTLSATGSYDINGRILSYQWTIGEEAFTGDNVTYNFPEGTHFITLTVTDDEGLTDSAVTAVEISYTEPPDIIQEIYGNTTVVNRVQGNEAPSLTASYTILDVKEGVVSFEGTGTDPDGNISKYEWDFDGDGSWDYDSVSDGNIQNTYDKPGYYMAVFRVTDNNGTSVVTVLSIPIRTDDIGGNTTKPMDTAEGGVDLTTFIILLIIVMVIAIIAAIGAAMASSKKYARQEIDLAADQEMNELRKLVDESRATGAQVQEAEAIIKELEGR